MQETLEKYRGIITGFIILVPMTGLFALCRYLVPMLSCTMCAIPSILWFAGAECGMAVEAFLYGRRHDNPHPEGDLRPHRARSRHTPRR